MKLAIACYLLEPAVRNCITGGKQFCFSSNSTKISEKAPALDCLCCLQRKSVCPYSSVLQLKLFAQLITLSSLGLNVQQLEFKSSLTLVTCAADAMSLYTGSISCH